MTQPTPMLIICDLDAGCPTRDGTVQPKGTAFDRVATSDFPAPSGCILIADDGRPLYVQNSGWFPLQAGVGLPIADNDAEARANGVPDWQLYEDRAGFVHQLKGQ